MKNFRLLLLCGFVAGVAACERHPYSDLEKLEKEHSEKSPAKNGEKQGQFKPASQHPVLIADFSSR